MKLVKSVFLLAIALAKISNASTLPKCKSVVTRREIRHLSDSQWQSTRQTLNTMQNQGWFSWFAAMHVAHFRTIHESPTFLPWHRRFIREFELVGQYYQPDFSLPYWDSSIDYKDPVSSIVLTDKYLGSNGSGDDSCVSNGLPRKWMIDYPRKHCLRRKYNLGNKIKPWFSPESITSDIQMSKTFIDISTRIEYGFHAVVHNGIGGDMISGSSPNDFAFFLHHCNVDRVWWKWQNIKPENVKMYNYRPNQKAVSLSDTIAGYDEKISDVMELGYGLVCYTYSENGKISRRDEKGIKEAKKVEAVLKVPEMSLTTGLQSSTLSKFFPLISAEEDTPKSSIDLPNDVSDRAVKYAQTRINKTDTATDVVAGSIGDTIIKQSNKMDFSDIVVNSNDKDNKILIDNFSSSKITQEKTTKNTLEVLTDAVVIAASKDDPKNIIPLPDRITEQFLVLNHYDPVKYMAYYNEKVGLVNALNKDGYVSPYN
ncbi:hypothetical protein BB561_005350 [Smittium simulii]|uniref:Tyrosinase copper-binding domain-containing protein n=1 Tax=Smittium simulii TaxID=133385 RepID=A0A2T9YAV5_9FUNG|nr:hypothetical protein BB561_005350 [Smittium simulii]